MVATRRGPVTYLPRNVAAPRVVGGVVRDSAAAAVGGDGAGAGRVARTMGIVTLGTGVGWGLVIDAKLPDDGGELGHTLLRYDGVTGQGTCTGRGHPEARVRGTAA